MISIEEFRIKDGWKANFLNTAVQPMVDGHMVDCAIMEEGPCTCGTHEELEAIAHEEYLSWHCSTDSDEYEDEEALEEKAYQEDPKKTWDYWDYK